MSGPGLCPHCGFENHAFPSVPLVIPPEAYAPIDQAAVNALMPALMGFMQDSEARLNEKSEREAKRAEEEYNLDLQAIALRERQVIALEQIAGFLQDWRRGVKGER